MLASKFNTFLFSSVLILLSWLLSSSNAICGRFGFEEYKERYGNVLKYAAGIAPGVDYLDYLTPSTFSKLDIDVEDKEMKHLGSDIPIILNRPLQHDTLVIGCGRCKTSLLPTYLDEEYCQVHSHETQDTWDINVTVNPSILAACGNVFFGDEVFKGHRYSLIHMEGVGLMPFHWRLDLSNYLKPDQYPYSIPQILFLLKEDGIFHDGLRDYSKTDIINTMDKRYNERMKLYKKAFKEHRRSPYLRILREWKFSAQSSKENFMSHYDIDSNDLSKILNLNLEEIDRRIYNKGWGYIENKLISKKNKIALFKKVNSIDGFVLDNWAPCFSSTHFTQYYQITMEELSEVLGMSPEELKTKEGEQSQFWPRIEMNMLNSDFKVLLHKKVHGWE